MAGFGIQGYSLALRRVAALLDEKIASAEKAEK
jgi:3-dehydroquinate dehydratase